MEKKVDDDFQTSSITSPFETTTSSSGSDISSSDAPTENHNNSQRKTTGFAYRVREHVKMGTVMGKLSIGAKIIKKGGRENIFRDTFGLDDGEKLFKASQCYLSTTQGPIAGILFISTHKVCFCSERSIRLDTCSGQQVTRIPYKLTIPVNKIEKANESENMDNPMHKYIQIVTQDEYEFWFMGFLRYEKAFVNLQKVISLCI